MIQTWRCMATAVFAVGILLLYGCGTSTPPGQSAPTSSAPISASAAGNMANNCFGCHGPGGTSPGSIPSIHQLSAEYLAQALRDFKTDKRPSTVMGRHAKAYSEAEIDAIARHIAGLQKNRGGAQ